MCYEFRAVLNVYGPFCHGDPKLAPFYIFSLNMYLIYIMFSSGGSRI